MSTQKKGRIAFAVCGSFCTLEAALAAAQQLTEQGWELLPIMSFAAKQDTRFGTGQFWQERLEALTSHAVLDTLQAVEPLGPKKLASALVIAPCTGATLARLAEKAISIHCWQGDDVAGFDQKDGKAGDGIQTTGNYPGKARNFEELKADFLKAAGLIPGC